MLLLIHESAAVGEVPRQGSFAAMVSKIHRVAEWFFARRPLTGLTIAGKMFVGYSVLVALTLGVVLYVVVSLYRISSLSHLILTVDVPTKDAVDKMSDAVLAQNTYERRYLVLRRKDLRHLFWERAREFDALFAELKRLRPDDRHSLSLLERLHVRYGDLFLRMAGEVRAGKGKAAEVISKGAMHDAVRDMQELLRTVSLQAAVSRDAHMRMVDISIRSAFKTTIALCSISIIFSILAGLLVTTYISSSLRRLMTAAGHVAEGRFDYASEIRTEDELGDLASSFGEMKTRLKKLEEMYRDASPLTRLPGGMVIERELRKRLDRAELMALCVMDIDNFKSFNDRYGYAHGNVVIKETATIVEQATRTHGRPADFVGHIGGDDFVVITTPDRIEAVCTEIISQFDQRIPHFYNDKDRGKGYFVGKNRQGAVTKFPLMTISIAVVTNRRRTFINPLQVSEVAAELKDYAKTFPRSLYIVDKRRVGSA